MLEEIKNVNQKTCHNCQKCEQVANLCAGCREVFYCSVDCQKQNWIQHKKDCQQKQEEIKEKLRLQEKQARRNIDWFERLDNIGQGNFSIILKMRERKTDKIYAVKVIEKRRLKQLGKEKDILMEKHALSKLSGSPNIIQLIDTFHDEFSLYIQMEYVNGGELWNLCRIFGLISKDLVKYFFAQIVNALEFMHSKGIVHRDIKPENILLTEEDKIIKFCDFGTSKDSFDNTIQGSGTGRPGKKVYEHFVGTPNFMPPECMRNKFSEFGSDIYCLGGTIFQLQTGFPPFLGKSEFLIFYQSEKQNPIFVDELWEDDLLLKDLILQMMRKNIEERISIQAIKQHKYFSDINWENLMKLDQCKRNEEEEFLNKMRDSFVEKQEEFKEKANELEEEFRKWEMELEQSKQLETKREKIYKRIQFMKKQARQFYNLDEFFWQDVKYQDESQQQEEIQENQQEEDESEDEDKE